MKTSAKLCGIAAALLLAASFNASAAEAVNPYVHSSSGQIVKNSTDLCWRTGFWTPALAEAMGVDGAGCACDADILDKQACTAVEAPVATKSAEKVTFSADTLFNFDRATLNIGKGKTLDIVVRNNSKKNMYIQSAKWNGRPYTKSYINYADLMQGGVLEFVMGAKPSKFGTKVKDRP